MPLRPLGDGWTAEVGTLKDTAAPGIIQVELSDAFGFELQAEIILEARKYTKPFRDG
jgi:hypothetical protein